MKPITFMLIIVLFILLACGDGDGDGGSTATPQPIQIIIATPAESNWPSEWEGPLPTVVVQP